MTVVTPRSVTLAARAKINLFLRVLEREPAGYHLIETVFQRIGLADDVTVSVSDHAKSLETGWDGLPEIALGPPESNLAWRAAEAYAAATGWPRGWHIALTKRIPAGAGLGGGSSDAAAVLCALDQLAPKPVAADVLMKLGATLGADVAFFVSGESIAIGRGRGDQIEPIASLPPVPVVLAIPGFGVATAGAYADLARARAGVTSDPVLAANDLRSWASIAQRQCNDFEATVFARHPELAATRMWLESKGAGIARLSGSGSVVFGVWGSGSRPKLDTAPPGFRLLTTVTE